MWRQQSMGRWRGSDDHGQEVGHVGLTISYGGGQRSWHGWRRDGTPEGIEVGEFDSAEAAMAAVDESG